MLTHTTCRSIKLSTHMELTQRTFVEKPIRIIHKASESDTYNYFLDANKDSATLVVEDSFYRMVIIDLDALPTVIEELTKISKNHEDSKKTKEPQTRSDVR